MKHRIHILAFILLIQLCTRVSADEPDIKDYGLVVLMDHQEPGRISNTIRVTIENRGKTPIKVIPPADIKRPWGGSGWWYCGSYKFYLHSATRGRFEYVCDTPRPPAAIPPPVSTETVTLLPGQSIGLLVNLPLPTPIDATRVGDPDEPQIPMPNWGKTDDEGVGKLPVSGYSLTVEYCPVEYQSGGIQYPIGSQKSDGENTTLKLVPPPGKKITSNALLFGGK